MSKKWFDTGYLKSKPAEVDHEKGIIAGVKVCSVGEARGHGVHLDSEFIDTLVKQGSETKQGLKARFGHPNMCSSALGTFVGRFKNFSKGTTIRDDGSKVDCCYADLFLSNSAKETPNGDLYSYILSMAENEADMFGTSIVFTPGKSYRRTQDGEKAYRHIRESMYGCEIWYTREDGSRLSEDEAEELSEEIFVECEKLHACDCVDEPAANDGLFSAFAQETPAGLITDFLDQNPAVFDLLENSPEVLEAMAKYGDKMDEFMKRYLSYRNEQEQSMSTENDTSAEVATEAEELEETQSTEEVEATEAVEVVEEETTSEEAEAEESEEAEPSEEPEAEESELSEAEPSRTIDPEEFARSVDEFGAEVSAAAFKAGGGYAEAKEAYYAAIAVENKALKAKVAELGEEGADPAEFGEDTGKKISMEEVISGKRK
ncbi:hypothetical protein PDESU_03315 [Pontiella desulfatans]|uniref:Uncharacterized protein n=1 Tax=Pontiella desulfatans TaxID=2750659 RepID=A0A6C2U5R6_PONDE|nr:hypothetical protein [Pontiella desulfatans]VGO14746.1 hypothetical protein PDESU_03315 [Pontiella desulfatans]